MFILGEIKTIGQILPILFVAIDFNPVSKTRSSRRNNYISVILFPLGPHRKKSSKISIHNMFFLFVRFDQFMTFQQVEGH